MKTFQVKMQINSKNEFKTIEVQAKNFKEAWSQAVKVQKGIVCAINEVK